LQHLPASAWAAGSAWAASTPGEPYPTKSIRIIDGFSAGGSTDFMHRDWRQDTGALWPDGARRQSPGAASTIGGEIAAHSAPDGHTMFITPGRY